MIILKWVLRRQGVKLGLYPPERRQGSGAVSSENFSYLSGHVTGKGIS